MSEPGSRTGSGTDRSRVVALPDPEGRGSGMADHSRVVSEEDTVVQAPAGASREVLRASGSGRPAMSGRVSELPLTMWRQRQESLGCESSEEDTVVQAPAGASRE